jgi:beta-glucanase (GH16 family)
MMTRRARQQFVCATVAALAVSASTVRAQLTPAPAGKQWSNTWADEFNNGAADLTGWSYDVGGGGWGNNEREVYTAPAGSPAPQNNPFGLPGQQTTPAVGTNNNNVFVNTDATGMGALTLRAIGTGASPNTSYTSGRIKTGPSTNLFSQTAGLFEFRAKMPAGNGLWPALWMMPKNMEYGGWPTSGEIDVMEGKGQDTGYASSAFHSGTDAGHLNSLVKTFQESGQRPAGFTTTAWHTYGFKWDLATSPGTLTAYIDGIAYHSRTGGWTVPNGAGPNAPFDKAFYLIMNLAVGGNFVGGNNVHPGPGTYDMQVDWVRAYSLINSIGNPTWKNDASGLWSDNDSWVSGVVPNFNGANAVLGSVIGTARTVTVDTPMLTSTLTFDNANQYTVAGTQTLTLSVTGGTPSINVLSGSHDITAPLALTQNTQVTVSPAGSTLTVSNLRPASNIVLTKNGNGALAVNNLRMNGVVANSGTIRITQGGTNNGASKIGTISFGGATPTGSLDLVDNALVVTTTPRATLTSAINFARDGGAWDQAGLTSSAAAENPAHSTTLGLMSGTDYASIYGAGATFAGQTVGGTDSLIKYTYFGDTDFNGVVNFDDYARVDSGFNNSRSGWLNGDFDFNDVVNFDDYALLDLGFNTQTGALVTRAVPEPGITLALGGLVACAAGRRGRQRRGRRK